MLRRPNIHLDSPLSFRQNGTLGDLEKVLNLALVESDEKRILGGVVFRILGIGSLVDGAGPLCAAHQRAHQDQAVRVHV